MISPLGKMERLAMGFAHAGRAAFLAAAIGAASPALAYNELFARDAPIARMTDEDLRIAGEAIRKAVENGQPGDVYEWNNPVTSAHGTVVPQKKFDRNGIPCREARFTTTAGGRTSQSAWALCKTTDGWKIAEGR